MYIYGPDFKKSVPVSLTEVVGARHTCSHMRGAPCNCLCVSVKCLC